LAENAIFLELDDNTPEYLMDILVWQSTFHGKTDKAAEIHTVIVGAGYEHQPIDALMYFFNWGTLVT
jgi:hypothetical protein